MYFVFMHHVIWLLKTNTYLCCLLNDFSKAFYVVDQCNWLPNCLDPV